MKEKHRHLYKTVLHTGLVFAMLVSLTIPSYAYEDCGYHLKGSWEDEYYYVDDRSDGYGIRVDAAVDEWNEAVDSGSGHSLDIELTETSDGDARSTRVVVSPLDRGPDGYAGFTYYYDVNIFGVWSVINYGGYPDQNYQSGSAVINRYYTDDYSTSRRQNVIMHEMGHIWGLMHSDDTSALMWESIASRTSLVPPQSDDIAGVRSIYE